MSASDLPGGRVTLLFTDVEGATKLLHSLGPTGYADALGEHRRVVRTAFERHGGAEVDTQGAPSSSRSVTRPADWQPRLHTGAPLRTDEGYVGVDVHRAARIAAAGHGRFSWTQTEQRSTSKAYAAGALGSTSAPK